MFLSPKSLRDHSLPINSRKSTVFQLQCVSGAPRFLCSISLHSPPIEMTTWIGLCLGSPELLYEAKRRFIFPDPILEN